LGHFEAGADLLDAQVHLSGDDDIAELASLWRWMQDDDELGGHVRPVERPIGETELGGGTELLTVTLASSGVAASLGRVLVAWLRTRRSDVKVAVTVGERKVELEATNVDGALPLLREVLGQAEEP
jgi:Effector Associated Constant Component 1